MSQVDGLNDVNKQYGLIATIRESIKEELNAINLYQKIANETDNKSVSKILFHIADEEKNHVGMLLKLIEILDYKEYEIYNDGYIEAEKDVSSKSEVTEPEEKEEGEINADHIKWVNPDKLELELESINEELDRKLSK